MAKKKALYTNIDLVANTLYVDEQDVTSHIAKILQITSSLESSGWLVLGCALAVILLLRSMPRSWDSIVTMLESVEGNEVLFTSNTVIARITSIAHRRRGVAAGSDTSGTASLAARVAPSTDTKDKDAPCVLARARYGWSSTISSLSSPRYIG